MFCNDKRTWFWEHWVNPVVGPDNWIGPAAVRWCCAVLCCALPMSGGRHHYIRVQNMQSANYLTQPVQVLFNYYRIDIQSCEYPTISS